MNRKITFLAGDGIGPEVITEARKVMEIIGRQFGHTFRFQDGLIGGIAIDETGTPLPEETLKLCLQSDAVLLGAVGGPKWSDPSASVRPEQGLLGLRKALGVFANLRPVKVFDALTDASPLRPERVRGVDLMFVRELTGGLYFGTPQGREVINSQRSAVDTMRYNENEIARVLHVAFRLAQQRRGKVTSVDKANVLASSRLWREITREVAGDYSDVTCENMLVDACAMHLLNRPADFDVIVTENMFGDILSDEASMIAGSLGMLPSASLGGPGCPGLYEPIHGSAPDIAGKGIANPLAAILSTTMMLRSSLSLEKEAAAVEAAVAAVLEAGHRTADLARPGQPAVSTQEMGDLVISQLGLER
jgi:3-isopropylmalate dehydrogenase